MSEQGTRRLAAIMFADMVGYTALMQEDEAEARARRDHHRAVLSDLVPHHRGEILQHYGDGTLSVFDSAVEAVECAIAIQAALRQPPEVALRIGVHSGDIVRDQDGVYGDGVNVASRIESLAAAGGVLVSGKVYDEIKNHGSISSVFLGEVELRNVKQPAKVYAITNPGLVVPSTDEIRARTGTALVPSADGRDVSAKTGPQGPGEWFLQQARERAMLPWAIAYLAGAWASLEIVGFLTQLWAWPPIVHRSFAVVAYVGFFVTLVVAWFHGERGRQRVRGSEVLIIAALLLVAGTALTLLRRNAGLRDLTGAGLTPPAVTDNRPSVAVLPFENLSAEPENAYFASGLHDEVITQLLRISGLRVISRTSVMEYASSRPNVREIGRELGVSHVTEATVQRIRDRLRVNVQLIDARTDDHLWAMSWDRELNDAFAVQSEVARVIADSLTTTLTAEERGAMSTPPTENPEAYRFYLQGRDYYLRPGYRQENYQAAERLFERAIALDPDFALAHAMLSRVHGHMYWESFDATPERLEMQRAESEEALRLKPGLPEAHVSAGWLHYVLGEYDEALGEYEEALKGLPNDAEIVARIGYTQRRLGNWPAVFEAYDHATELNPRNATLFYDLGGHSFAATRRYADAVKAYDRALSLAPDLYDAAIRKGFTFLHWRGQLDSLQAALARIPLERHLPEVDLARADLALWQRDPDALRQVLLETPGRVFETQLVFLPKALYSAWADRLRGDTAGARSAFATALDTLEPLIRRRPNDARLVAALGFAQAGLGMRVAAGASASRTFELGRQGGTASAGGGQTSETAAIILAQAGMAAEAVGYLKALLSGNSAVSVWTLRRNPMLDPIRDDPGFRALVR